MFKRREKAVEVDFQTQSNMQQGDGIEKEYYTLPSGRRAITSHRKNHVCREVPITYYECSGSGSARIRRSYLDHDPSSFSSLICYNIYLTKSYVRISPLGQ
jgi:hypothetical protein